jgi:hypothetical protein
MDLEAVANGIASHWRTRHRGKPTVKFVFSGRWNISVNQYGFHDRCKVWGGSDKSLGDAVQAFWDAFDKIEKVCDCAIQGQPENPFAEEVTR